MTPHLQRLYLRSRGLVRIAPLAIAGLIVLGALLPTSIPVILGDSEQRLRTPALIGLAAAMFAGPGFARGLSPAEWVARRALQRCRAAHVGLVLVMAEVLAITVSGTMAWTDLHQEVFANAAALIGITLATVSLTSFPYWAVTLPVVAASYLMGAGAGGHPHPWAWLLWEPDRIRGQEAIDVVLLAGGFAAFLMRPGRASDADG